MAEDNGVIYLEVDDDITAAVDKLVKSPAARVQIVATKRSSLFQSVINLKLLQKAAKDSKKQLVLVSNDRTAINLAGRLGVPVASQVGEAARVPTAASAIAASAADDEIDGGSVGEAAKPDPTGMTTPLSTPVAAAAAEAVPTPPVAAPKKPKGSKVPSIGSMQKKAIWGVVALLVVAAIYAAFYFLTTAKVDLYANASEVNANFSFTADPSARSSKIDERLLAAQQLTLDKSITASVQGTGTKDLGTKASGTVTIKNCEDTDSRSFPAGSVVSSSGKKFLTEAAVTIPEGDFSGGGLICKSPTVSVDVTASQNGDSYNLAPGSYTSPALTSNFKITGNQMQGGTTKTAKIITQEDIAKAQAEALESDKTSSIAELFKKANKSQRVIDVSQQQLVTSSNSKPAAGEEGQTATLALQLSYSVLAVEKADLSKLAKAEESKQLGPQSQIYDDGSAKMEIMLAGKPQAPNSAQKFSAGTVAYAGTKIDTVALAKQLKGKKYGEAVSIASGVAGVDKAEIKLSPGWTTSLPRVEKNIRISIKVAGSSDR